MPKLMLIMRKSGQGSKKSRELNSIKMNKSNSQVKKTKTIKASKLQLGDLKVLL